MRIISILFLLLSLSACGSLPYKDFDNIKVGMDKSDVTEEIGSPLHVRQNKQPHVWIYRFYDEDKNEVFREIRFEKGKVIYAGPQVSKEKILWPNGSGYTQKDLEEYIKEGEPTAIIEGVPQKLKPSKTFQDQQTMEDETLKDLAPKDDFKEIKPSSK
ncbi:MAG: hypothetical protein KDD37_03160 [Bdellovibrionales bacterium]|nr:hypothetical protein [Bdellovibrionales bacterium]